MALNLLKIPKRPNLSHSRSSTMQTHRLSMVLRKSSSLQHSRTAPLSMVTLNMEDFTKSSDHVYIENRSKMPKISSSQRVKGELNVKNNQFLNYYCVLSDNNFGGFYLREVILLQEQILLWCQNPTDSHDQELQFFSHNKITSWDKNLWNCYQKGQNNKLKIGYFLPSVLL